MGEISRFYGIVITMYPEAGERHNTPHFHVRYSGNRATLEIATGDGFSWWVTTGIVTFSASLGRVTSVRTASSMDSISERSSDMED